jgi:hypothetical protein
LIYDLKLQENIIIYVLCKYERIKIVVYKNIKIVAASGIIVFHCVVDCGSVLKQKPNFHLLENVL